MADHKLPVAIIGAGPVGLAAAAQHLARGGTPVVLEAGKAIGQSLRQWAHVRMFSLWEYNVDKAAAQCEAGCGCGSPVEPQASDHCSESVKPVPKTAIPARLEAGELTADSPVLDLSLYSLDELRAGRLETPLAATWVARKYQIPAADAGTRA